MTTTLAVVAASGLAREALAVPGFLDRYDRVVVLDDDPARWGGDLAGQVVVDGGLDRVGELGECRLLVCAGSGRARRSIVARLRDQGVGPHRYATVRHPSVELPDSCSVGSGSILLAHVSLTADVRTGRHVVAMPGVTLTHDDVLEDFATICAGVSLGGAVTVREAAYLGMNSAVREGTTVGRESVLGMGAVLLADLPDGETWAGTPARPLPHRTDDHDDRREPTRNPMTMSHSATPSTEPDHTPVPLLDLRLQNDEVADEVRRALDEVCASGAFVLGPQVRQFEEEYAAFCGVDHVVGVGNGTDALVLALRGAGICAGDEVIVPANTFVATAEAVALVGADLSLVDCTDDFLIDTDALAHHVTDRTRAVIGVDLYGQVAPFEAIRAAVGADVVIVEDAAQSQGASRFSQPAGSFGHVAATSFYPGKNLGAFGDAGAVATDDEEIATRIRALRNHGGLNKYEHLYVGTNSRLDSMQAAVLSVKLRRLKDWNAQRDEAARRYETLLAGVPGVVVPRVLDGNRHVWHLYEVRVAERDRVLAELGAAGIGAGLHYPAPVHLLPAFAGLGLGAGSFPVAEALAGEILSLPMYPGITSAQQERVVTALAAAVVASS
jgi:sugar O-acyltransferase (sialic acid O-acetyltransferase NeuD family)